MKFCIAKYSHSGISFDNFLDIIFDDYWKNLASTQKLKRNVNKTQFSPLVGLRYEQQLCLFVGCLHEDWRSKETYEVQAPMFKKKLWKILIMCILFIVYIMIALIRFKVGLLLYGLGCGDCWLVESDRDDHIVTFVEN